MDYQAEKTDDKTPAIPWEYKNNAKFGRTGVALVSGIIAIISVIVYAILAREFTQNMLGIYQAIVTMMNLLIVVSLCGLEWTVPRFIAQGVAAGDTQLQRAAVYRGILINALVSLIVAAGVILLADPIAQLVFRNSDARFLVIIMALAVPAGTIATTSMGALQGFEKFGSYSIITLVSGITRAGTIIFLLSLGVFSVLYGWIASYVILIVGSLAIVYKIIRKLPAGNQESDENPITSKLLLVSSLPLLGYRFLNYLLDSIDQFMVVAFAGVDELGPYSVTIMSTSTVALVAYSVLLTILIPRLTAKHTSNDEDQYWSFETKVLRICFLIISPFFIGLVALSTPITEILSGTRYLSLAPIPTAIAGIGLLFLPLVVVKMVSLIARGKALRLLGIFLLSFLVEIICGFLWIPYFGIIGAAASKTVAMFLLAMNLSLQERKNLGQSFRVLSLNLASAGFAILLEFTLWSWIAPGIVGLTLTFLVGTAVYVSMSILIGGCSKGDLAIILSHIPGLSRLATVLVPSGTDTDW